MTQRFAGKRIVITGAGRGLGFAFLVLPSIAAVAVGWAVRHWALAAAVIAG